MGGSSEKWQKDLTVYKDIDTTFIIEGNIHDKQPWFSELEGRHIPVTLTDYLNRYLEGEGYEEIVYYNAIDGFYNRYKPDMVKDFYISAGVSEKDIRTLVSESNRISIRDEEKSPALTVCEATNIVRKALSKSDCPKAVVIEYAKIFAIEPDHMSEYEVENITKLMQASLEPTVSQNLKGQNLRNLLFIVVEKVNDIPAWFYLDNPMVKVLTISKPSRQVRESIIASRIGPVKGAREMAPHEKEKLIDEFALVTEGLSLVNIDGIITIMRQQGIDIHRFRDALKLFRYGETESHWDKIEEKRIRNVKSELGSKVKGQEAAVNTAANILSRACMGLSGLQGGSESRPKGVMFFAGPTGTGKTELAKRISEFVFGDESFITRFDMSEYGQAHSDQKLLGAPPGYVGYSAGGQLTNAIKEKPFCILLFDEIEKAHPTILDKFLQILEDGRLTDSSGETVYFSESMIIFTSNLGINGRDSEGNTVKIADSSMEYSEVKDRVQNEIENYFKFTINRPEILNRIGENIVVFDFIRENVAKEILELKLEGIKKRFRDIKGIKLQIDEAYKNHLISEALGNLDNGGRGIVNILEKELVNKIAEIMLNDKFPEGAILELVDIDENENPVYRKMMDAN